VPAVLGALDEDSCGGWVAGILAAMRIAIEHTAPLETVFVTLSERGRNVSYEAVASGIGPQAALPVQGTPSGTGRRVRRLDPLDKHWGG
jgi:hypothetical protein